MKTHLVHGFCFAAALTFLASPSIGLASTVSVTGTNAGKFNTPYPNGWTYSSNIQNNSSGPGSSKFTWGTRSGNVGRNWMEYKPTSTPISVNTEGDFMLGTLTYFNGTTTVGSNPTSVFLQIALNLTSPLVATENFNFKLELISTENTGSAQAQADYVKFPSNFTGTTFAVNDVEYTLEILGFRNATSNGGFVGGSQQNPNEFHVYEGKTATAELWGRVTAKFPGAVVVPAVPEPASMVSAATAGLIGLTLLARRRRKVARG